MQNNKAIRIITVCLIILGLTGYFLGEFKIDCLFHKITGLYCPGCGITRSLIAIIHLDFYQAFRFNPYVFLLLPLIIPYLIYQCYIWIFDYEDKISSKIPKSFLIFLIITLVLYGLLRNISYFSWLAPTKVY